MKLTVKQLEFAKKKTLENAEELLQEAELLMEAGRFARAYVLGHLSCEEMAKVAIFGSSAKKLHRGEKIDWSKLKKRLLSHEEKNKVIILADYIIAGVDWLNDCSLEEFAQDLELLSKYNYLKNAGLYSDGENGQYVKPSDIITEALAEKQLKVTRLRMKFYQLIEKAHNGEQLNDEEASWYTRIIALAEKSVGTRL